MADATGNKEAKNYHLDIPPADTGFFVKGLGNSDWGMKNRLARVFNPRSGNTVMLAFDHGNYTTLIKGGIIIGAIGIAPLKAHFTVKKGA